MVSFSILFRKEAENDLKKAFNWYEDIRSGLGDDFILCIEAAISQVLRFPESSPIIYKDLRRVLIPRFPFGVFYLIKEEKIIIMAVFHQNRMPDELSKRR